jgi:hypothetical protein
MEKLKQLEDLFNPDVRSAAFVRLVPETGPRQMTMSDQYEIVSSLNLHAGVPDEIRSYFESVKMLCLYAFLYYPFYSVAQCFSAMAVEVALRHRMPKPGGDRRGLGVLFKQAVKDGIIDENNFDLDSLRMIRNEFVHARAHWIVAPAHALTIMHVSIELINALWDEP